MEDDLNQTEPAIEAIDLSKHFGPVMAVNHLNITVNRGEIFGFLGPNGAGKTTSMRMLLGLVHPSAGKVRILGLDIATKLAEVLRRTGALIENTTFYPFLSGRENLAVIGDLTGTTGSRIDEVLGQVDMLVDANRSFSTYSLGMKQRIGVAGALLTDPELLILDEPANGLDPAGIVEMRTLMQNLREEGHTVLISSHVLHEIEQICDRIAIMNHGQIVAQGTVQELLGGADRIEIIVERPAEAIVVLKSLPGVKDVAVEEGALIVSAPVEQSAQINKALSEHGFYASIIRPRHESLERYFLELTGAAA